MTSPRTFGRRPSQRDLASLPVRHQLVLGVADHADRRQAGAVHQPDFGRAADEASRTRLPWPTTCADIPADRAICPPLPGLSSMLCTSVPSGISRSGSALPMRTSEPGPDDDRVADGQPLRDEGCSASRRPRTRRARYAPTGSDRTRCARPWPAWPNLLRLKSMMRYCRLCPPPRRRIEMWPWLSRPPDLVSGSTSDFSGVDRVISAKSETERKRELLVTGLN